jgi:hypothetical protein
MAADCILGPEHDFAMFVVRASRAIFVVRAFRLPWL